MRTLFLHSLQHRHRFVSLALLVLTLVVASVFLSSDYHHYRTRTYQLHDDTIPSEDLSPSTRRYQPSSTKSLETAPGAKSNFHLILTTPTTDTKENICKLLLSITALGYPTPGILEFDDEVPMRPEDPPATRARAILGYLEQWVSPDDLVLIVDGQNTLFQLRPDVLISRYYDVLETENQRLAERMGGEYVLEEYKMKQSVVFGASKACTEAPHNFACWGAPESSLLSDAFGPETDSGRFKDHNRPRWLDSGVIIGPGGDLTQLFAAIGVDSRDDYQHQMTGLFSRQQAGRQALLPSAPEDIEVDMWVSDDEYGGGHIDYLHLDFPIIDPRESFESHMTIDYASKMFQTTQYYWKYIDWFTYDNSTFAGQLPQEGKTSTTNQQQRLHFNLPEDILASPPPFAGIGDRTHLPTLKGEDTNRDPRPTSLQIPIQAKIFWKDMMLGTNIITGEIFPIIHTTPDIDPWHDLWFFPYGEAILKNAAPARERPIVKTADGREWWAPLLSKEGDNPAERPAGGSFDGAGTWRGWDEVCKGHEEAVFFDKRGSAAAS